MSGVEEKNITCKRCGAFLTGLDLEVISYCVFCVNCCEDLAMVEKVKEGPACFECEGRVVWKV